MIVKIEPRYLEKMAYVYLRQSSPGQVKRNVEGGRRQRRMEERVKELGWPSARICLLGGDTGLGRVGSQWGEIPMRATAVVLLDVAHQTTS